MGFIKVDVRNVSQVFKNRGQRELAVLKDISIQVEEGKFVSVLGPSGCGKSTLLNIVSGLIKPTAGQVLIDGEALGDNGQCNARLGYVFQTPRLLGWMTLEENIQFVLQAQKVPKKDWKPISQRYIRMTGLSGFEHSFPRQLSGGMQQRTSIARALAIQPDVILMDEPFSHLDEITARKLRSELISIWQKAGKMSILFVTHDMSEAVFLSDVIYFLTQKPCSVFERTEIPFARPRDPEDVELFETKRQLLKVFYANAERELTEDNASFTYQADSE